MFGATDAPGYRAGLKTSFGFVVLYDGSIIGSRSRWVVAAYDRTQGEIATKPAPTLAAGRRLLKATRDGADEWIRKAVARNLAKLDGTATTNGDDVIVLVGCGYPVVHRFTRRPTGRAFWIVRCPKCESPQKVTSDDSMFECDIATCCAAARIERENGE